MQLLDLKQTDITQSRFYQEIRQEGEADLLIRQLKRRFGSLSTEQSDRLKALSVPQLEELAEALLDFTDLSDLLGWLGQQEKTIAELS